MRVATIGQDGRSKGYYCHLCQQYHGHDDESHHAEHVRCKCDRIAKPHCKRTCWAAVLVYHLPLCACEVTAADVAANAQMPIHEKKRINHYVNVAWDHLGIPILSLGKTRQARQYWIDPRGQFRNRVLRVCKLVEEVHENHYDRGIQEAQT